MLSLKTKDENSNILYINDLNDDELFVYNDIKGMI